MQTRCTTQPSRHHPSIHPLLVELALVESEFLTLEDVSIAAAGLAGTARDDGEDATGLELLLDGALDLATGGETSSLLLLDAVALLDLLNGLSLLHLATAAEGLAVVSLIPLAERSGIDLDNGGLSQGVGADKLVVGRVVYTAALAHRPSPISPTIRVQLTSDDNDTGLAGDALGGPREVAGVETQGTVLVVTAAGTNGMDALGTDTGVRRLTARLEGSLLPCPRCQKNHSKACTQAQNTWGRSPCRRSRQDAFQVDLRVFYSLREEEHTVVTADTQRLAIVV